MALVLGLACGTARAAADNRPATRPATRVEVASILERRSWHREEPKPTTRRAMSPGVKSSLRAVIPDLFDGLRGKVLFLRGGEPRTVELSRAKSQSGKPLDNLILRRAGVELTLQPAYAKDPDRLLTLGLRGDPYAVRSVRVLGSDGTVVGQSDDQVFPVYNGMRFLPIHKPLDDTMRVEIEVLVGQKPFEVPFDLRDIPLP